MELAVKLPSGFGVPVTITVSPVVRSLVLPFVCLPISVVPEKKIILDPDSAPTVLGDEEAFCGERILTVMLISSFAIISPVRNPPAP